MKKKIMIALVSLMLVFSMAACGKHADGSTENEQDSGAVVEEENTPTDSSGGEIAERMSKFSLGGYEVSLPCTVGDFKKNFEIELAFPMPDVPDTMCCSYLIDGESAGVVFVYSKDGKVHDSNYIYLMSVDEFSIVKEHPFPFEVSGIMEAMTREQVKELWGEPCLSEARSIIYCDGEYENSYYCNKIIIDFDDISGKISEIMFNVNLDRIEELEDK